MGTKFKNLPEGDSDQEDSDEDEEAIPDEQEDHNLIRIGVIADTEVTIGLLLAGVGYTRENFCSYLMVDTGTTLEEVESFFHVLYRRPNIGLILIDYPTAKRMHHILDKCKKVLPVIVIVPSKGSIGPYMEEKDRHRRQRQRDAY
ncbi:probable V-type proton ATPase subunit F [Drosophila hydei]|uniref:Probable V-type proton ATPase subunit F n=1 Tax=Drosophila hydei TaxID=7224 RepID=A0A6J1LCJ1_DROHY|nr:probable V-type proton ATPase subunit F [Drosophila hydei]